MFSRYVLCVTAPSPHDVHMRCIEVKSWGVKKLRVVVVHLGHRKNFYSGFSPSAESYSPLRYHDTYVRTFA